MFKFLTDESLQHVRAISHHWCKHDTVPDNVLTTLIICLHKSGDPSDLVNYIPLNMLDSFYKIIAGIILQRLATALDRTLPSTQTKTTQPEQSYISDHTWGN